MDNNSLVAMSGNPFAVSSNPDGNSGWEWNFELDNVRNIACYQNCRRVRGTSFSIMSMYFASIEICSISFILGTRMSYYYYRIEERIPLQ